MLPCWKDSVAPRMSAPFGQAAATCPGARIERRTPLELEAVGAVLDRLSAADVLALARRFRTARRDATSLDEAGLARAMGVEGRWPAAAVAAAFRAVDADRSGDADFEEFCRVAGLCLAP